MNRLARNFFAASVLLTALFFVNLIFGKIRLLSKTGISAPLDGVPEFILLMFAVGFFIAALLVLESDQADEAGGASGPGSKSDAHGDVSP